MTEARPAAATRRHDRPQVVLTGLSAVSAYGRGNQALLDGVLAGRPAFAPVTRFDVEDRRVRVGALLPGDPSLVDELLSVVDEACAQAGLSTADRAATRLLLAVHGDPDGSRPRAAGAATPRVPAMRRAPDDAAWQAPSGAGGFAAMVAAKAGLAMRPRTYTSACVAASTAVADAAAMITAGDAERLVVAAGYLVDPDQFALFDAGRALAADGAVRPFSAGRKGLLLGDGVAAVVLESDRAARARKAEVLAAVHGWGRAGDGYHVVQPRPDGAGLARAIGAALDRAGFAPAEIGYVNAHGSGSAASDAGEAAALHRALGGHAARVPISSTKSLHGQALEASPLLELVTTVLTMRAGLLPVNAGFLEPDPGCELRLITGEPLAARPAYALSLNAAFGGANTALVIGV
ncbi:beta-ketoacyl-[acyl-carrier-protein] synthase family protein [Catellatospora bangladeshensis]|uniref:3-oxoacyl-[acyl-carrier-protein] synthase 2 n=1 Tax=Catellatospora bangladeshensis TaxID=310355 RepID=A0A8J3NHV5_9ACTN|nr:beta-ketoacyl synthase N-terminal-like domain-containing protein [Catellatospora bangladeshensis]GIF78695.1 3-oxoacyl-[acyl-carrier-protein] synthase 2 [Catellatospora bangladeshensis]